MDRREIEAHFQRAVEHQRAGRHGDAERIYRQLLIALPNHPDLHLNLANALEAQNRVPEAIPELEAAIRAKPDYAEARFNLGCLLKKANRTDDAVAAYQRALAIKPDYPDALNNLATIQIARSQLDQAAEALNRSIQLNPHSAPALCNLGIIFTELSRPDEAMAMLQRAMQANPRFPGVYVAMGKLLSRMDRLDDALAALNQAIQLQPDFAEAYECLGYCLHNLGRLHDSIAAYRRALELSPSHAAYHSGMILTMQYHPSLDAAAILAEEKNFDARFGRPLAAPSESSSHDGKIRIGYVSADFRNHVVARNLLPMFRAHNRDEFEIFLYCNNRESDWVTEALRACTDHFRTLVGIEDDAAETMIRSDRIDILIDLSQHTGRNRLSLFARKPAPIQICFGAYPGGTGLKAIDYRISDPHLDPPDSDWKYVEKTLRLPDSFWLYNPQDDDAIGPLPALSNGFITFGCLNNYFKLNDAQIALWSRILKRAGGSKLVLLAGEKSQRDRVARVSSEFGIDPKRIEMLPRMARKQYMLAFQRIDLSLDPYPYNGHMSSLDAMWMGVPVVTRVGERAVSRGGLSLLSNLGLPELVAKNEQEYVDIALGLAGNLARLSELRGTLRQKLLDSALTDGKRFAANMETLYRRAFAANP